MKETEINGFVVRRKNLGDGSLILTIYSKENGKISVVAKGIKKQRAKLQSFVEPLIESKYRLIGNGRIPILVGVTPLKANSFYYGSTEKNLSAILITEILDKLTSEENTNHNLYVVYKEGIQQLLSSEKTLLVVTYIIMRILQSSGFEPHIISNEKGKYFLNLSEGTVSSSAEGQESLVMDEKTVKLWKILLNYDHKIVERLTVEDGVLRSSISKLVSYIEYSTQKKIKSAKVLFDSI